MSPTEKHEEPTIYDAQAIVEANEDEAEAKILMRQLELLKQTT